MSRVIQFDTEMLKDGYTPTEAMIYGYLWWTSWKTRENEFCPSIGLMKKSLNLSKCTILRGINKLENRGLIEVFRGYRTKNTYLIVDMDNYPAINNFDETRMGGMTKFEKQKKRWYQNDTNWYQNDTR